MIGSPYYWAFVAAITVAFAAIDLEALRRREMSRLHGASVALYAGGWVIVVGLGLPVAPLGPVWWVFPAGVRIAVAVMFSGGQLLAEAIREEQRIVHHEQRPANARLEISEAELSAAEEFDAEWQAEDRRRNRERERQAREERRRGAEPPSAP
jgi:hypothetical protein